MASQYYLRTRPPSATGQRAERLLGRYPNVSEQELAELINLLPSLPVLDFGLLTADERVSDKLDAFHRDHGDKLRTPISSLIAFMAVPTVFLVGLLWWALM